MKNPIIFSFCVLLLPFFLASCRQDVVTYSLEELTDSTSIQLNRWTVLGVLPAKDTLQEQFLGLDHMKEAGVSDKGHALTEERFCKVPYTFRRAGVGLTDGDLTTKQLISDEAIIDIAAAFSKKGAAFMPAKGAAVYLFAQLESAIDETVFLTTRSSNGIKVWLNGDSIYHSYEFKGFEMTASEFIPLRIKKGINQLVIKRVNHGLPWLFEGTLCGDPSWQRRTNSKRRTFCCPTPWPAIPCFCCPTLPRILIPRYAVKSGILTEKYSLPGRPTQPVMAAWTSNT